MNPSTRKSSRLRTLSSRAKESDLRATLSGTVAHLAPPLPTIEEQPAKRQRLAEEEPASPTSSAHSSEAEADRILSDNHIDNDTDLSDYEDIAPAFCKHNPTADSYDPVERLLSMARHQEDILFNEEEPVLCFASHETVPSPVQEAEPMSFKVLREPAEPQGSSLQEHLMNSTFSILDHSQKTSASLAPAAGAVTAAQLPVLMTFADDATASFEDFVSHEYWDTDSDVKDVTDLTNSLSFLSTKRSRPMEYRHHDKLNLALPETVHGSGNHLYRLMAMPLSSSAQQKQNIENLFKVMNKRSIISGKAYSEMVGTSVGPNELVI